MKVLVSGESGLLFGARESDGTFLLSLSPLSSSCPRYRPQPQTVLVTTACRHKSSVVYAMD